MALQRQIWSTFVTVLWCSKTEITHWTRILFLWESCEIWFPKFTDNFGIVSSKMHLKAVLILLNNVQKIGVQFLWHQCQCQRDVWHCIHYDISLYQRTYVDIHDYMTRGNQSERNQQFEARRCLFYFMQIYWWSRCANWYQNKVLYCILLINKFSECEWLAPFRDTPLHVQKEKVGVRVYLFVFNIQSGLVCMSNSL